MKKFTFAKAVLAFMLPLISIISLVLTGNNILIALLSAIIVESIYCLCNGVKWTDIEDSFIKGGQSMLGAVLIMILVGIMIAVWMASGTIPTLLFYGMKIINPQLFLPITFLLCALTAVATGTSWGAAGTMGIALIGAATGLGIPLPMVCGAVLSGAIIGDKMSPLSDSVLLASASTETNIFDLISSMMYTTIPLGTLCLILYAILGLKYGNSQINLDDVNVLINGLSHTFTIHIAVLLPLVIVIGMSMKKIPTFITFTCGIVSAIILAVIFQRTSISSILGFAVNGFVLDSGIDSLDSLLSRGGALSMAQIAFASIMAGMFSGMLKHIGILDVLTQKLRIIVKSTTSLITTTVCFCVLMMLGGGGQYTTLTLPGAAFMELYDEMDVHSAVLGRTMEDVGTMIEPIIPWTVSGVFYSGLFGVSVAQYTPYVFMAVGPILAIINAIFGLGVFRRNDEIKYRPLWRRKNE